MRGGVSVSLREILFRGKRVDSGAWSYGSLVIRKKDDGGRKYFISGFEPFSKAGEVLGETVGEYTGFRDTSGNAVFEGDVVEDLAFGVYEVAMTMWGFRAVDRKTGASYGLREFGGLRRVGTVFDEPYRKKEENQGEEGQAE